MPFVALCGSRVLSLSARGLTPLDAALDVAAAGASITQVQLPAAIVGEVDDELAACMVTAIRRLIERGGMVSDDCAPRRITPEMIGVSCAHVSQVNAIRERLGSNFNSVFVETANRFQGLERQIMFVYHPLSGRADATEFHLDAGRLCVMLSRHRVACFVFARDGITRQLLRYAPTGDRVLGAMDDPEYRGWRAHLTLMEALTLRGRIFPVEPLQRVRRRA
jgi:hypothetical protein